MDQALNQKIDAFIAANKEQWLKDIEALVSINSVESTPAEGAPFGQGARAALDKTLELAAGMGFALMPHALMQTQLPRFAVHCLQLPQPLRSEIAVIDTWLVAPEQVAWSPQLHALVGKLVQTELQPV